MTCPKCGYESTADAICPRCGVVFAKVRIRETRVRSEDAPASRRPAPKRSIRWAPLSIMLVAGVALAALLVTRRPSPSPAPSPAPTLAMAAADIAPPPSMPLRSTIISPSRSSPSPLDLNDESRPPLNLEERHRAQALVDKLNRRLPIDRADVEYAAELQTRSPQDTGYRDLLFALLMTSGDQERSQGRLPAAIGSYQRATAIRTDLPDPHLALLDIRLDQQDWTDAENSAREALKRAPQNLDAQKGLALALFRQDRDREAAYVLETILSTREDPVARALLNRIRKTKTDERGMTQQVLSHFNVRYDGDEHESVGRGILRILERHYATLTTTLDYQPSTAIPVILFSRANYLAASGAPAWSGGAYDALDGRVRVPIGGLTESLAPELDSILLHELTHAFVADATRGTAPRELHEGLAQYMEGKRIERLLTREQISALADNRTDGVAGYYLGALSFVEYLYGMRGQGGINDLLKRMGESRSTNAAFRDVYGKTMSGLALDWSSRLRTRYGSS